MGVVPRHEKRIRRRFAESSVLRDQIVKVVDVGNAGRRGNQLSIADESRSPGAVVWVVGSLRRDDDGAALGFEGVDRVGQVFDERVCDASVGALRMQSISPKVKCFMLAEAYSVHVSVKLVVPQTPFPEVPLTPPPSLWPNSMMTMSPDFTALYMDVTEVDG